MTVATLRRQVQRLRSALDRQTGTEVTALLARLRQDPAQAMTLAGLRPDSWQRTLLRCRSRRTLLLCSRQAGKSTVAGALALSQALTCPRALVLLLSPTQRQSGELFRKVMDTFGALGRPVGVVAESALRLELANGARVVALPGVEATVRCFSGVSLLVVDEAARVHDDLYRAVRPMLATSGGRLVALSTPFGKRGWFHDAWSGRELWQRVRVTADQCPRIPADFLEEERQALGERWFNQEYGCSFEDVVGAVFAQEFIDAALCDLAPLPLE